MTDYSDTPLRLTALDRGGTVHQVEAWGAEPGATTDATSVIQARIDYASALATGGTGFRVVSGGGKRYLASSPIRIKPYVVLRDITIVNNTVGADEAIVYVGDPAGGGLVRTAGAYNVRVETSSTSVGAVGFRIVGLVRGATFRDCYAAMNASVVGGVEQYEQVGYEILAPAQDELLSGGGGTYGNLIDHCFAYGGHTGFRIKTNLESDGVSWTPEANANYLKNCVAYSCYHGALSIVRSQDNRCEVRADTFNTTVNDLAVVTLDDANYNSVDVAEEVGTLASGTQYVVRFVNDCRYNEIEYHTQNAPSASNIVDDSLLDAGADGKNWTRMRNRTIQSGGEMETVSHYTATVVGTSVTQEVRDRWIAPRRCLVTKITAKLTANTTTSFQVYAAKNAAYTTSNRITFSAGEGTTAKSTTADPTAAGTINSQWILEEGDTLVFAFTNGAGETNRCTVAALIKYLE